VGRAPNAASRPQRRRLAAVALALAAALPAHAEEPGAESPAPPKPSAAPELVWEDISYGTGESDFTAVAVDPDNSRRFYAGAAGSVFATDDGGRSWTRILSVRGSGPAAVTAHDRRRLAGRRSDSIEDRVVEAREELVEQYKQEITDDLVSELGSYGEQLAAEIAEDLAEQRVHEEEERLAEEVRQEMNRRGGEATDAQVREQQAAEEEAAEPERSDPRRIHRVEALPGGRLLVCTGSALFVSSDRGGDFRELQPGMLPADHDVRAVAVHPRAPEIIVAATTGGLFATQDAGEIWIEAQGIPDKVPVLDVAMDPRSPDRVFAATKAGVYVSNDGAQRFVPVLEPLEPSAREVRAIAADPQDPRIVFAGTADGLFRSLDGGMSWERLEPTGLRSRDITELTSLDWGLVVATRNGVYLSPDCGESFRELHEGLDERDVRRVAGSATPLDLRIATGHGLFSYRSPEARARRLRTLAEIRELLRREPGVDELMREALRTGACDDDPRDWRRRASLAPLAPRLAAGWNSRNPFFDYYRQHTDRTNQPPEVSEYLYRNGGPYVIAFWDVERLIGAGVPLDVSRNFRKIEVRRRKLLARIAATFTTRRRLQIALLESPPSDLPSFAYRQLQVDELTAVLDGLTGGHLTRRLDEPDRPAPESRRNP